MRHFLFSFYSSFIFINMATFSHCGSKPSTHSAKWLRMRTLTMRTTTTTELSTYAGVPDQYIHPYKPYHNPTYVPDEEENHTATSAFIFLHGLGDSGNGWSTELSKFRPPHMRIVCPHANRMLITLNHRTHFTSWYDQINFDHDVGNDLSGAKNATEYIHYLIDEEIKSGIPPQRIIIGGFAQGGAMAIHVAQMFPQKLAGVITLCTHAPPERISALKIPLLQCHSENNPRILYKQSEFYMPDYTRVDFKPYVELTHVISKQETDEMKNFIQKHIAS